MPSPPAGRLLKLLDQTLLRTSTSILGKLPALKCRSVSTEAAAEPAPGSLKEAASQMPSSALSGPSIGRRFYKSAYAKPADDGDGYVVMLDHRTLKTPSKKPLKVPSFSLAHAIAAEWQYQDQDGIRPFTMPLMKLTSTVIDKVPLEREKIIKQLLHFFHTDSVCCREKDGSALNELQAEVLNPLLDWIEKEIGFRPTYSSNIFVGNQPDEVVAAMEKALKSVNDWQLAAVDALSAAAKSLVIAMAISRGRLDIEEAIQVIRLEEDYQIEEWGLVEGGHDIDVADLQSRVAAASVFLRLL